VLVFYSEKQFYLLKYTFTLITKKIDLCPLFAILFFGGGGGGGLIKGDNKLKGKRCEKINNEEGGKNYKIKISSFHVLINTTHSMFLFLLIIL
jgi:hypothetical protein